MTPPATQPPSRAVADAPTWLRLLPIIAGFGMCLFDRHSDAANALFTGIPNCSEAFAAPIEKLDCIFFETAAA